MKAGRTIDGTDYVSPSSTTVSAALTPEPVYPAAPTGEHITSIGKDSISMEWDDAVDATSWRVYRAASYGGSYSSVSGTITTNSYTDDNLTYGTTYYYKIRAYNADGNSSEYSSILSGTTLRPPVMTDLLIQSYGATVKYDSEYDIQYLYRTPGTSTWYTPGGIVFPGGAGTQVQLIRFEDLFESENPLADVEIRLYCPVTGLASDEIYTIRGYFDAVDHDGSWSGSVFLDSTSALGGPSSYSSVWIKIFLEAGVTYQITTSGGGSPSLTGSTIDIFNEGFAYSGQLGDPGFDSGYLTPSISEYHYILLRPDTSGSSFDSEYGGLTVSIQPYNG